MFCPAAAELAHDLHMANSSSVFSVGIHAGPDGIGDFQAVSPPDYPTDFTNPQGVEIGQYFGENDGGFPGNPRGTVNRVTNSTVFQSPAQWTSMTNEIITNNESPLTQGYDWKSGFSQWLSEIYQSNSENMFKIIEPTLDKVMIDFALEKTGGKKQEAAKVLGLGRNTLTKKIKAQQT